jgi:hypothetical protein
MSNTNLKMQFKVALEGQLNVQSLYSTSKHFVVRNDLYSKKWPNILSLNSYNVIFFFIPLCFSLFNVFYDMSYPAVV